MSKEIILTCTENEIKSNGATVYHTQPNAFFDLSRAEIKGYKFSRKETVKGIKQFVYKKTSDVSAEFEIKLV